MSNLRRRPAPGDPARAAVDGVIPVADAKFSEKYPTLTEFLTRVVWEDGTPREKGTFFLFVEDGMFKACVNDKDSLQVAFLSSVTFTGLLDALEKGFKTDSLDWRLSTQGKGKKSR